MNDFELNRVAAYRQLKKEIRGSKAHLIVGIDIAKNRHMAFLGTATGKSLLRRLVFENTIEGFERLLVYVEGARVEHTLDEVVFGLEPTAQYHKPLAEYLIKNGYTLVLVGGEAVKKNRSLLDGRWDKHDMKDAANVADLISQGKCLYYDFPSMDLRDLRNLLSLKRRLKKQEHGWKVRIRNHLLAQYFPEMDRYYGQSEAQGLPIVRWCLDPDRVAGLDFKGFLELVAPQCRMIQHRERLRMIWESASRSIGCEVGESPAFESRLSVEGLRQTRSAVRECEKKIKEICARFPEYPCLLSIPGFGPDISAKVIGAIGNPRRFKNQRQVLRLAGMDLGAHRSGNTSDSAVPVISKKGKAELRYALFQAALIASCKNQYFKIYFTHKLRGRERERGIKTKMRIKLAAKMLVVAWNLMKKQELFDLQYLKLN